MICVMRLGNQCLDVVSDQALFVAIENRQGRGVDGFNRAERVDGDHCVADRVEDRLNAMVVTATPLQFPQVVEPDPERKAEITEHLHFTFGVAFEIGFIAQQVVGREELEDGVEPVVADDRYRDRRNEAQLSREIRAFAGEQVGRIVTDDDRAFRETTPR